MTKDVNEMISIEKARDLVVSKVETIGVEKVSLLDVVGRVSAEDLTSDMDVAPFPHSAMDGFALREAARFLKIPKAAAVSCMNDFCCRARAAIG